MKAKDHFSDEFIARQRSTYSSMPGFAQTGTVYSYTPDGPNRSPRVLHLSFHRGCIREIQWLAQRLSLQLSSWYIHSSEFAAGHFDGSSDGSALYNIGRERAWRVWDRHKDYFDQFDMVITSDTAPLSRIFLQNGWDKPLIVWICNRFDYSDQSTLDCSFPDARYYELFREAATMENVRLVSYTRYEQKYASTKGVNIGDCVIRPSGGGAVVHRDTPISPLPSKVKKSDTLFLYPRLPDEFADYVVESCKDVEISVYPGTYRVPEDLEDFCGILYFPYAYSNFALFENIRLGIIHFVPDQSFLQCQSLDRDSRVFGLTNPELSEWYLPENRDLFVYFRSWQDLKHKMSTISYPILRRHIRTQGRAHERATLDQWRRVIESLFPPHRNKTRKPFQFHRCRGTGEAVRPNLRILYTAALIDEEMDKRKQEYIRSLEAIASYGYTPDIVETIKDGDTFFDRYGTVHHPGVNRANYKNKGVNEARALLTVCRNLDMADDEVIVKLTGRYCFRSDAFFQVIERNSQTEAFVKLDEHGQIFTGCFAMSYGHFLKLLESIDLQKMERDMVCFERLAADYVLQMDQSRIKYLDNLDLTARIYGNGVDSETVHV